MSSGMSSGFSNLMKKGWHPEKEGTTFKGQVNGLLGRNKEPDRSEHVARPLASLQDPSTFAPPPKRVPGQPLPPPSRSSAASPGAPPPSYEDSNRYAQQQEAEEEAPPPPQPFRVNTTGLSTSHLPPPPGRKDGADGRTPVPGTRAPPSLPPRLPPRNPSAASSTATSPASPAPAPSSGGGYLNQKAMNRLGAAGVSVPSLGIGKPSAPEPPTRSNSGSPAPPSRTGAFSPPSTGKMSELQNRFAKLGKSSSGSSSPPPPPSEGTTWEQKQSALRTASNFHKDPSSVSMADARSAASTLNNFRQRHGDQVAAGVKSANNLNQKYGIADKVGHYAGQAGGQQQQTGASNGSTSSALSSATGLVNALGKKKPPPPPPPKKKPQIGGAPQPPADDDGPPPIPLATKPTF